MEADMTRHDALSQLHAIATSADFPQEARDLAASWVSAGFDTDFVEDILRFIEENPRINYGSPGPLAHYVERFYGRGYEAMLVDSLRRKPTPQTVWMLNRVINGTDEPELGKTYVLEMERAGTHPLLDEETSREVSQFLDRLHLEPQ